ncbi:hypothetical protein [Burkholderia territorii]|uniref:hypothetical protein n=1 Tax=Burkholderia territorii TaxID=1503055 RepID=UPI0012D8AA75|nr:hypothetical protein [Burkholderia territorii]
MGRSIVIHLPDAARDVLTDAAPFGIDRIDQVTARLRREYPDAFHSMDSLPERGFAHAPSGGTPHRWYAYQSIPQPLIPKGNKSSD